MSAPARLLALRLQGFKSFAERTIVEFGPGISAVVGPNGSGKSNLADALRWSLGEQGRALRSRKSEDVIFAGSEKRSALGMADVTLVLDNADGLLPVDYGVLELGRRLYRSGENDYLLNKQRIRLRDLVNLLDAAHLADNAFLFIGQGMVDQALALRPEERRPLFEEVAGVRRHERRRRKAEEQLAESEANLARVEDIVAELRPQARRLAAQAEQQATRLTAADELVSALLAAAHLRWHEAAAQASAAAARVERERRAAASAMADLQSAEDQATAIATELTERAATEQEHLAIHDAARSAVTELRLREARTLADLEALERDRVRLADERATAEASVMSHRRDVAVVVPGRDLELDAAVAEADRLLAEANDELARLRAETHARGEEAAALRRAEAARHAEAEAARRRLAEATRRAADERAAATAAGTRRAELDRRLAAARETLDAAASAAVDATNARDAARSASVDADSRRRAADERAAALESALAARNGHLAAIEGQLREEEERGIARSARRRGGRRLDEELAVDAAARAAVEAALDELARAYIVDGDAVSALAAERGVVVVRERASVDAGDASDPVTRRFEARLGDAGAVRADGVIRRDPTGTVRRVLARTAIVDDLAEALALQPDLPPGWTLVTRDGGAVVDQLAVRLGRGDAPLERRAEVERLRAERERLRVDAEAARGVATTAEAAAHQARRAVESAAAEEAARAAARRRAEEEERAAARDLEAVAREAAWHGAQAERLEAEVERAREALVGLESDGPWSTGAATSDRAAMPAEATTDDVAALDAWQRRAAELRARRDRLAADQAAADARRREVESRLARAEASAAMDEERIRRAERDLAMIAERVESLTEAKRTLAAELGVALERERAAAEALATVRSAAAADRDRLGRAEREASAARERLRAADERLRAADRSDLEARLGRDALREQLLVELAGLGELGRRRLEAEAGVVPIAVGPGRVEERRGADARDARMPGDETGAPESAASDSSVASQLSVASDGDDSAALESALDALATRWAEETPSADVPGPARLATLRRRYHELGAANPFAVEEYEALRERLETLESQQVDLRAAIEGTRRLIAELNTMIATQFRATFTALETAFDGRFQQLFGGGFARLSLTDPDDLAATGVEIVARPPGKKPQALAMLSGGERALTAVALLFAMLEVRPVPFCVLDEVDAALDEANVGRFSEALRGLADRTQFVVITHNRGTIEVADALYGVTVGDDSVSRVISLRLDEAQAIADRERGATMAEPGGRNGHGDVEPVDELAGVG